MAAPAHRPRSGAASAGSCIGAVERKDGNADDYDQHQRHIGENDAVRVAPEHFDRLCDLCGHRTRSGGTDPQVSMGAAGWGDSGHGTLRRGAERQRSARRGRLQPRRVSAVTSAR